jgi:hypothetical protein
MGLITNENGMILMCLGFFIGYLLGYVLGYKHAGDE